MAILNLKTVDKLVASPGIKPILTLGAQTITPCQLSHDLNIQLHAATSLIMHGLAGRLHERVAIDLMLSGGLRVSEVLEMNFCKVNALGQVFIRGLKGSSSKLVTPLYFRKFWLQRVGSSLSPFLHISRFLLYKYMRSNGIGIVHGGARNNSVTHAMRHLHVFLMEMLELESADMSVILGHKSLSSLKYYIHGNS